MVVQSESYDLMHEVRHRVIIVSANDNQLLVITGFFIVYLLTDIGFVLSVHTDLSV